MPIKVVFLLLPQFSMMAFAAALEPLRAANRLGNRTLYEWTLASADGEPVKDSNGISLNVQSALSSVQTPQLLLVCAGLDPLSITRSHPQLRTQVQHLASHGCRVGGISSGAFLLAEAGLLDGRRCTVHWEYTGLFAARYPHTQLVPDLFVADGNILTCSGGTAALELMLQLIHEHGGQALASKVAEHLIHPRLHKTVSLPNIDPAPGRAVTHPKLSKIIRQMESALAEPLAPPTIATEAGLSTRQVERLFQRHLHQSPGAFYLALRLRHARQLLRNTALSIHAIAADCGFNSTSHFCHSYRRHYGHSPTMERKQYASLQIK